MNFERVERLAKALLYEGYLLYPYRPSALKNRYRWLFGCLFPRSCRLALEGAESWSMQIECLVQGDERAVVAVKARFLHPAERPAGGAPQGAWQEAIPREVASAETSLGELCDRPSEIAFAFARELAESGGAAVRTEAASGALDLAAERAGERLFKVTARIRNTTPLDPAEASLARDALLLRCFASTHLVLGARGGELVSLADPPAALREAAAGCRNLGAWPVLVGDRDERSLVLGSPIVLEDYPRVAPESPGDLFDATEIDEILTLRILTLTDAEKQEMRAVDERTRALLERTERLGPEDLLRLHGVVRSREQAGAIHLRHALRAGDRVRLRPRGRADIFDLVLAGKAATIAAIEEDHEGRTYLAVTVDEDPGRDLGDEGLPGHRFFFHPDDVEPLS